MLIFAFSLIGLRKEGLAIFIGAVLFVISDSLLALNKFVFSLKDFGWLVMATYSAAVLMLAIGLRRYTAAKCLRTPIR